MKKFVEKSVLFLGIGGVSMHKLALFYKTLGYKVYGYDEKQSEYVDICVRHGIEVSKRVRKAFLNVNFAVATGAIKADNKYVLALKNSGVKIRDRAEVLGELCARFKCVVAVAGTHGKSTTASLIYEILRAAGKKVSCHIGADLCDARMSEDDDIIVVEACEYNKSFLHLFPTISVVTNIEAEHMDSYKSLFNLKCAFSTFLRRAEMRFVFLSDSTKYLKRHKNINFVTKTQHFLTKLKGEYNQKNISLAFSVCKFLGVKDEVVLRVVKNFSGIPRRYEMIGRAGHTKIYIDYAHHPTEIREFIRAFNMENENCLIVFQPHTYSRTKTFLKEFVEVFKSIKDLYIYKEYPAREKKSAGLTAHELYLEIKRVNPCVKFLSTYKKLTNVVTNYKTVAFVGAGNINLFAKKLLKNG